MKLRLLKKKQAYLTHPGCVNLFDQWMFSTVSLGCEQWILLCQDYCQKPPSGSSFSTLAHFPCSSFSSVFVSFHCVYFLHYLWHALFRPLTCTDKIYFIYGYLIEVYYFGHFSVRVSLCVIFVQTFFTCNISYGRTSQLWHKYHKWKKRVDGK